MRKTLVLTILLTSLAGAQTEVRRAVALPSYKDLKFAPLPPLKIPEPAFYTLANGMKVYLLEDHELPIVSGFALVRTGNLFDPSSKRGLAQITGAVLRSGGTRAKSGDEIDVQLENIAASIESEIGESSGTVSFSTLRENTGEVLSLFRDFLTLPEFRQDKVELEKTQTRSLIARRNDDANGIATREFDDTVYGKDNSYGWPIEYEHIDNIQRQDLIDFYRRYYFPANVILAVYGDFSTAEMKTTIEGLFGGWHAGQAPVPAFPEVRKDPAPGVFLATKTDVTQTFFEAGHLGGELRDKDYPALEVAADILGGGFSSRLFERIRTKLGYAYGISASWNANFDHPGTFQISGSTQSAHTVDTLRAVREELDKMRTSEVTDQELQTAKDTALNGFVFRFDRPSKTLNRLITYEYFGYPKNFIFDYQKGIAAVTKADVLRVAKQYFHPQDLTIVAVGNPKDFGTPLTALGMKVEPIDLTIPAPKKVAPKVGAGNPERGKELLARMRDALGGGEKVSAVKDVQYSADITIQGGPGGAGLAVKQHNSFLAPSTMRQDIELPFGKQSVFYDGSGGWMSGGQGTRALPPEVIKQFRGEIFRELYGLALSDQDPGRTVLGSGDTLTITDPGGESVMIELDAKGVPGKLSYESAGPTGPTQVEESFSDWRDVDGVQAPFHVSIMQGGKKFAEGKVVEYKVNSHLNAEDLGKKP